METLKIRSGSSVNNIHPKHTQPQDHSKPKQLLHKRIKTIKNNEPAHVSWWFSRCHCLQQLLCGLMCSPGTTSRWEESRGNREEGEHLNFSGLDFMWITALHQTFCQWFRFHNSFFLFMTAAVNYGSWITASGPNPDSQRSFIFISALKIVSEPKLLTKTV